MDTPFGSFESVEAIALLEEEAAAIATDAMMDALEDADLIGGLMAGAEMQGGVDDHVSEDDDDACKIIAAEPLLEKPDDLEKSGDEDTLGSHEKTSSLGSPAAQARAIIKRFAVMRDGWISALLLKAAGTDRFQSLGGDRFSAFLGKVISRASKKGMRSAGAALGLRMGIALLFNAIKIARKRKPLSSLASGLVSRSSLRFSLTTGTFSLLFTLFHPIFLHIHRCRNPPTTTLQKPSRQLFPSLATPAFAAGAISGLSLLLETPSNRIGYMQIATVRALQALLTSATAKGLIVKPWYTEGVVFTLVGSAILYAATMRPDTLPKGYLGFLIDTAGSNMDMLTLNNRHVRSQDPTRFASPHSVTGSDVLHLIQKQGKRNADVSSAIFMDILKTAGVSNMDASLADVLPAMPCVGMHPSEPVCTRNGVKVFMTVFRKIFPVYAVLNAVPVVARPKAVLKNPVNVFRKAILSTLISSNFLASCGIVFQGSLCVHRSMINSRILQKDHKLVYWIAGLLSASSIFIERSARHAELAVFGIPKAAQSLYCIFLDHGYIRHVTGSETLTACMALGTIMALYKTDPGSLVSIFSKGLDFVVGKDELVFEVEGKA